MGDKQSPVQSYMGKAAFESDTPVLVYVGGSNMAAVCSGFCGMRAFLHNAISDKIVLVKANIIYTDANTVVLVRGCMVVWMALPWQFCPA